MTCDTSRMPHLPYLHFYVKLIIHYCFLTPPPPTPRTATCTGLLKRQILIGVFGHIGCCRLSSRLPLELEVGNLLGLGLEICGYAKNNSS